MTTPVARLQDTVNKVATVAAASKAAAAAAGTAASRSPELAATREGENAGEDRTAGK